MSAAATAAGYLYASGRLRSRGKEEDQGQHRETERGAPKAPQREKIRVAVYPAKEEKPRRTPKIEYRTRKRWSAE